MQPRNFRLTAHGLYLRTLALAMLLLAGCGLSDYEKQMAAETERLQLLDKSLGYPVEFPPKVEGETPEDAPPTIPVYLRPPRGIARTCEPQRPGTLVQRYNAPEGAKVQAVYLAASEHQKRSDFRHEVLSGQPFGGVDLTAERELEELSFGRRRLLRESLFTATGAASYFIYFYWDEGGDYQVAVIYQVEGDQAKSPEVETAIDASLRTLVVGPDAARMRYKVPEPPPTKRGR